MAPTDPYTKVNLDDRVDGKFYVRCFGALWAYGPFDAEQQARDFLAERYQDPEWIGRYEGWGVVGKDKG